MHDSFAYPSSPCICVRKKLPWGLVGPCIRMRDSLELQATRAQDTYIYIYTTYPPSIPLENPASDSNFQLLRLVRPKENQPIRSPKLETFLQRFQPANNRHPHGAHPRPAFSGPPGRSRLALLPRVA